MRISIYSLKKVLFDGEAESINCETASGQITVLNGHRPLISMLTKGTLKITCTERSRSVDTSTPLSVNPEFAERIDKNQKEVYIPVSSGFLEVLEGSRTRIIAEEEKH